MTIRGLETCELWLFSAHGQITVNSDLTGDNRNACCYCYSTYQTQHTMLNIFVLNAIDNDVRIGTKNYNEIDEGVEQ